MSDVLYELHDQVFKITLNRIDKNNAFDDKLLAELLRLLEQAETNETIRCVVLNANGKHFSAGADLAWMKRMAEFSEQENVADATVLANVMHALNRSSKPTIAVVQGSAYGGGAGLAAACDVAIASENAKFCFSEVKLGLIPAVISPYVVHALGARVASWLFMSAEVIDAKRAYELGLVHYCVPQETLQSFSTTFAETLTKNAPEAVKESKKLVQFVQNKPITAALINETALLIAKKRVSEEGQRGLNAFLNKETPAWD
ncbi:enoyl-CoA hydratase-related protein [Legionella yabuuchiae]|uniref:enoyl-CoA hydratase-related protein n=1 Tax=Legionella yabuuchiae TaxID=376727 RepID=UPI0010559E91|nr:enoyl-CoA hydratase-related protein [Legionella yabuuchiae]